MKSGLFELNGQAIDYYDYVRARLGGRRLRFDPLREIADMVVSNCADLGYRANAVTVSLQAGLQNKPEPERLPPNIYSTEGDWETFSTPSRDARLKTAFKEVRDNTERFLALWRTRDPRLFYGGDDLASDMARVHARAAQACSIVYVRSDRTKVSLS